jgi:Phage tail assembly chaperone proteins, E, or 41 or 14
VIVAEDKNIIENADGSMTVTLSRGIDISGVLVNTLQMREPVVGDQLAAQKLSGSDADKDIFMLANLCMLAPSDIQKLKLRDFKRVQDAYLRFFD